MNGASGSMGITDSHRLDEPAWMGTDGMEEPPFPASAHKTPLIIAPICSVKTLLPPASRASYLTTTYVPARCGTIAAMTPLIFRYMPGFTGRCRLKCSL